MAPISSITWTTPAGLIDQIQEGEPYNFVLQADTTNIITLYSIISGQLPPGLTLTGSGNPLGIPQGTISGTPIFVDREETYPFTIRIQSSDKTLLSDRSFSLTVLGAMPPVPLGNPEVDLQTQSSNDILTSNDAFIIIDDGFSISNLGTFPDGTWISTNITATNINNPSGIIEYDLISGNLPTGLSMSVTGNISGYVDPNVLKSQNAAWDIMPLDTTNFDWANSNLSANFTFDVRLTTQDLPIVVTYNMVIERSDYYYNNNANVAMPYYHSPIFPSANHAIVNGTVQPTINLGNTNSDANFVFQFNTLDFENDPTGYQLVSGEAAPYIVPSNLNVNANTGWLSGYINENQSSSTPYQFIIRAFKKSYEESNYINNSYFQINNATFLDLVNGNINANTIFHNDYQTLAVANIVITDLNAQNINWLSNFDLGNITIGTPSTLRINSTVSVPFTVTTGQDALAVAFAKLNSVEISSGGSGYTNGDILTVNGGVFNNAATITVVSTGNTGQITNANVNLVSNQNYSTLPILTNNNVLNGTGNNARFNLNFGIETVKIQNVGQYYAGALIGFSSENETEPAIAIATIYSGAIKDIVITNTGNNYQNIPDVLISSCTTVTNANPIIYSITDGSLPLGLELMSNGMIVGRPSYQAISNNNYSYNVTVKASVGSNYPVIVAQDIPNGNTSNLVLEEFQELTFSEKTFNINLISPDSGAVPKTNLSLEFLLGDKDSDYLQNLIQNVAIIPNNSVYRSDDFYFGRCKNYRMLIGYGINPNVDAEMIAAIAKYYHDKKYLFTELSWAQSLDENGNVDYEVIYIVTKDQFTTNNGNTFSGPILGKTTTHPLTADTTQFSADDLIREASYVSMATLYPATLPNMIQQLKNTASDFDYTLLPSWMTSTQPNGKVLGFTTAIPLVYLNPGQGQKALYNIQQYISSIGIGLNSIVGLTDRYIWDESLIINWDTANNVWISNAVDGFTQLDEGSQYLKFRYRDFMATQEIGEEF